ncbi:excinuclease ABC subunit UvrA [Mucilaginibacter sp. SMC90]|uniref:excinuclease ABC subunit UvrA n=1 Tax=Mucilaginibacter sp. SMC90 TaxID=2929803 RepID=UPI001FB45D05|nr:excinuclease ABC subunit UvrA [Mucilaginibacter sp. SMC90]UOE48792.1 excinuclease ABC subunit UvrA [Mucilaginibacter sp. SMC90]
MSERDQFSGFVRVKGAREHNLKNVSLEIPRDALVVFTGISGSGKSSLAFGTLYAEAQRRYLESVSPYARRLFNQMAIPEVDEIDGLPPAVALQQQRGSASTRSSVGSVTTLSNLLRMLYSRAGDYPEGQGIIYAESFSPNTPEGACPECHGLGRVYEITEQTMVPDDTLTIREKAIAAWPSAWQGQNQRDILTTLGYDIDIPWKDIPQKDRHWILFTEEQPVVPVYSGYSHAEIQRFIKNKRQPDYMGTFTGARRYVRHTFANSQSAQMKKRVSQYMLSSECPLCQGKRLKQESLSVKFAGYDIAELSGLALNKLATIFQPYAKGEAPALIKLEAKNPEKVIVAKRIAEDFLDRLQVMLDLGLGYLTIERSTPTLSPGELQRLRLATQVRSNLFGVVYVLDEPSAGLHPADTEALLRALDKLKASGNSLFVVEHEIDVIRHADWIVDVGPAAGEKGGHILYSGLPEGLKDIEASLTRHYIYDTRTKIRNDQRTPQGWLELEGVTRNNLKQLNAEFPLGVLTSVTGVSGSGKSSLVSQVLVELVAEHLGVQVDINGETDADPLEQTDVQTLGGRITAGMDQLKRLVVVDQKPIGRTPRSNLATYTGLFDHVRKLFAATPMAKAKKYDAGRFSFNVAKGRCPHCEGEGFVMVELLFLPSVYTPCPTCGGTRYNPKTLEVKYKDKHIAEVLALTVDEAANFFDEEPAISRALEVVHEVGLGYLRLGQPATELSGGEAQRIKLATELQRVQHGQTLYILDEPTTGLHPSDVERLMLQLNRLVDAGNTVILVEHDMQVIAASDWVVDIGPGAGEDGGKIVGAGTPRGLLKVRNSRTAPYLAPFLQ